MRKMRNLILLPMLFVFGLCNAALAIEEGCTNTYVYSGMWRVGTITTSDCDDTVTVNGLNLESTLDTGMGSDNIFVSSILRGRIYAGEGDNIINVPSHAHDSTITSGSGADIINIGGGETRLNLNSGAGDDKITITGQLYEGRQVTGEGDDVLEINTTSFVRAYIDMGSGNDVLKFSGDFSNYNLRSQDGKHFYFGWLYNNIMHVYNVETIIFGDGYVLYGTGNEPPVLNTIGDQSAYENELLEITLTATDPDSDDSLTFTADNLPADASFDASTATFSWTPKYDQAGNYEDIQFCVQDDGDPIEVDCELITITVGNVNRAPIVTAPSLQEVQEYDYVEFTVSATDPDGDNVFLSANTLPAGATFDASIGNFAWTPNYEQAGTHTIIFYATDDGVPNETGEIGVIISVSDISPDDMADEIIDTLVNDLVLTDPIVNNYMAHLKKVKGFIQDGKITPAIKQLEAFQKNVHTDINNGDISEENGLMFIAMAQDILDKISTK